MIRDEKQFTEDMMYMAVLLARADGHAELAELALPAIYLATYWNVDRPTIEASLKKAATAISSGNTPDASAIADRLVDLDEEERRAVIRQLLACSAIDGTVHGNEAEMVAAIATLLEVESPHLERCIEESHDEAWAFRQLMP